MTLIWLRVFLARADLGGKSFSMKAGKKLVAPVRFSQELMDRVDAISRAMALSHSAVLRMAVSQWFEAGGDKTGPFAIAKKSAKKAAPKGRGKQGK
jgi:predicted transcriptional regulator